MIMQEEQVAQEPRFVRLKVWLIDEAARDGVHVTSVNERLRRGLYPDLKIKKVNSRHLLIEDRHPEPKFKAIKRNPRTRERHRLYMREWRKNLRLISKGLK